MADGRLHRQPLPLFAAVALLLPAIIALAVWLYANQQQRGSEIEDEALQRTRQMIELADAELSANMRILALVADSPSLRGELTRWRDFIERSTRQTPGWRAVVLRRAGSKAPLAEGANRSDGRALRPLPGAISAQGSIEGAFHDGRHCPCVILHRPAAEDPGLIVSLYLDPERFQRIVQAKTPPGAAVGRSSTGQATSPAARSPIPTGSAGPAPSTCRERCRVAAKASTAASPTRGSRTTPPT